MRVYGGGRYFRTLPISNFLTPPQCPTTELISHYVYGKNIRFTKLRVHSYKIALTSDANHKSSLSPGLLTDAG